MTPDSSTPLPDISVTRALISVSDKTGIPELARELHQSGVQIISTGGTARLIRDSGLPVTDVSAITGFPECLDGRVKTLHPKIHGALLARPKIEEHARTLRELDIQQIQLLVVNLYPFREAVRERDGDIEHAVENIDIGGPAMVRASAKNFENVCVATHPDQYRKLLDEIKDSNGWISGKTRAEFAIRAFQMTASYDQAIADSLIQLVQKPGTLSRHTDASTRNYNTGHIRDSVASDGSRKNDEAGPNEDAGPNDEAGQNKDAGQSEEAGQNDDAAQNYNAKQNEDARQNADGGTLPIQPALSMNVPLYRQLRYGENPHQAAAVYGNPEQFIDCFHGKELSYNNYLDIDAALRLGSDFSDFPETGKTLCAIFKHTLPCGVALADSAESAWKKAFSTDTTSPFGGIVLFNSRVDAVTASLVDQIFTEIILAPSYTDEALELLKRKSNRRLIRILSWPDALLPRVRSTVGGYLWQHADAGFENEKRDVVTRVHPDENQLATLEFAWIVAKHVTSNAIVYARDLQTIGVGAGQPNRVDASRIASAKAKEFGHQLKGCVVASDAFFPFADGVEEAVNAGASAVIQPGGSIRDKDVIARADELGIAMILTGTRHFRH